MVAGKRGRAARNAICALGFAVRKANKSALPTGSLALPEPTNSTTFCFDCAITFSCIMAITPSGVTIRTLPWRYHLSNFFFIFMVTVLGPLILDH